MKISDYSVQKLGDFIAGDPDGWPYRSGPKLIAFFNKLGFQEIYGQGFPSRLPAKLAVNSAKTLADFLFDSMNYQIEKGSIKKK